MHAKAQAELDESRAEIERRNIDVETTVCYSHATLVNQSVVFHPVHTVGMLLLRCVCVSIAVNVGNQSRWLGITMVWCYAWQWLWGHDTLCASVAQQRTMAGVVR